MEHACITHNINGNIKVNRTILTNPGQKLGHLFEVKQLKHEVMTSLKSTIWNLTLWPSSNEEYEILHKGLSHELLIH